MGILKKILIFFSAISLVLSQEAIASKRLSGAGATFPSKIYTRWFFDLAKSGGPRVNYQAVGSGSGRKAFIYETVNFGASDDPMKDTDIAKVTRGLVHIPMVGEAIAVGVEPKQKALLEFNALNLNNLAKWKLIKLLCY